MLIQFSPFPKSYLLLTLKKSVKRINYKMYETWCIIDATKKIMWVVIIYYIAGDISLFLKVHKSSSIFQDIQVHTVSKNIRLYTHITHLYWCMCVLIDYINVFWVHIFCLLCWLKTVDIVIPEFNNMRKAHLVSIGSEAASGLSTECETG